MTTITIANKNRGKIVTISNALCELFQGVSSYQDNEILVSGANLNEDTNEYECVLVIGWEENKKDK